MAHDPAMVNEQNGVGFAPRESWTLSRLQPALRPRPTVSDPGGCRKLAAAPLADAYLHHKDLLKRRSGGGVITVFQLCSAKKYQRLTIMGTETGGRAEIVLGV